MPKRLYVFNDVAWHTDFSMGVIASSRERAEGIWLKATGLDRSVFAELRESWQQPGKRIVVAEIELENGLCLLPIGADFTALDVCRLDGDHLVCQKLHWKLE